MEKHIGEYYQIIEKAITILGVDPLKTRKEPGRWALSKGANSVFLYITPQKENPTKYYFQVSAPIMEIPKENQEAFYQQLLTLNNQLLGAAFVDFRGFIYISTIRETKNISTRETLLIIKRVGDYASFYNKQKEKGILNWPLYNFA